MSEDLSPSVRERLSAHLDAVELVLIEGGRSREQRRAVVDDLESQIVEMLHARSSHPTLADVEAVLRQVDPPNAYGSAIVDSDGMAETDAGRAPATPAVNSGYSIAGIASLVIFCTAGIGELALVLAAMNRFSPSSDWRPLFETAGLLGMLATFAGVILGIAGMIQKRRRRTPATLGLVLNGLVLLISFGWLMSASTGGPSPNQPTLAPPPGVTISPSP